MHKIDYETFFKTHSKDVFQNEYLVALGIYEVEELENGGKKYANSYEELNRQYKDNFFLSLRQYAPHLPENLEDVFIASYELLVTLFLELKNIPNDLNEEIKTLFDYDKYYKGYGKYSEHIRDFFCKYADELNLYSCAYCECAYTGHYDTEEYNKTVTKGFFDLDHFFPKADYPLFALSLYNFVPSCQICNSRVKGRKNFLEFYNIDIAQVSKAEEKLLHLSPVSKKYDFEKSVFIRYIPKLHKIEGREKNEVTYKNWHYEPLSQEAAENYEVLFDTDFSNDRNNKDASETIIDSMKLNERYNSAAIRNDGLYLLDLKKRYPVSHIKMMSDLLSKSKHYVSPEEIENAIFHKEEEFVLLRKLRNDLLE